MKPAFSQPIKSLQFRSIVSGIQRQLAELLSVEYVFSPRNKIPLMIIFIEIWHLEKGIWKSHYCGTQCN